MDDLADRFKVSQSTLARTFTTCVDLMYVKFTELMRKVDYYMPPCFKTFYPSIRVITDCNEFFIHCSSPLASQSATFSAHKNTNTCKLLVGISPDGAFTFLSPLYEGSLSQIVILSSSVGLGES